MTLSISVLPLSLNFPICKAKGMLSVSVGGRQGPCRCAAWGQTWEALRVMNGIGLLLPWPPWGGHVDLQTWLRSTAHGSLPWSLSGMFSLPSSFSSTSSSSCALSMGLLQCPRAPPGRLSPLPPGFCPEAYQAVSNLDAMHLAPSDHSRLFDGTNDDLGLWGPGPPQTEINPASAQTRGLQPSI